MFIIKWKGRTHFVHWHLKNIHKLSPLLKSNDALTDIFRSDISVFLSQFRVLCSFWFLSRYHTNEHTNFHFQKLIFTSMRFLVLCFGLLWLVLLLLLLLPSSDYQMDGYVFENVWVNTSKYDFVAIQSIDKFFKVVVVVVDGGDAVVGTLNWMKSIVRKRWVSFLIWFVYDLHRCWNRFVEACIRWYENVHRCVSRAIFKKGYGRVFAH